MSSPSFLDNYEPLDIIGNGSFGIIRKVRRKTDGLIFARKELNFERMSERDRKQIVAEVNILKDLHHDHIVRYHDRYVDRDAGILYILMEYCDTVWHYFLQILHALHHCHHPNGHGRSGSGSATINGTSVESQGSSRRAQILHRDLKPDNVFLDENNIVKLGDFGLSKALAQTSFANTYVNTPYYMSPELMQEKAYDSKSDIWSLGCLIYELCALKPPFHEAKTHSELIIFIRNGRIPPLPRGYSQSLTPVIKSMLNLNPAMRPSAAQLLQHERLDLVAKVVETGKMRIETPLAAKEREIVAREQSLLETQQNLASLMAQKDHEISSLQHLEEIMNAVRNREVEVDEACAKREALIKKEVDERIEWVLNSESELRMEEACRKEKNPLEEVKNLLEPLAHMTQATPAATTAPNQPFPSLETPTSRAIQNDFMFNRSLKVGLNSGKIFNFEEGARIAKDAEQHHEEDMDSPPPSPSRWKEKEKAKDKEEEKDNSSKSSLSSTRTTQMTAPVAPPPTRIRRPSIRTSTRSTHSKSSTLPVSSSDPVKLCTASMSHSQPKPLPRPHLRPSNSNSNLASVASSATLPIPIPRNYPSPEYDFADEENLPSPFLKRVDKTAAAKVAAAASAAAASSSSNSTSSVKAKRRGSSGLLLRAVAAANSAGRRGPLTSPLPSEENDGPSASDTPFPSAIHSHNEVSEEARKALLRP
ncbi:kinase-like domain-containing protein [Flammula alnicola]|nr:kinase-like domain-containing protein [Flammula alnicola]